MDERTPPITGMETETVTSADGTEIAFKRTGSGPSLVLVYGNGDTHQFWEEGGVRPALAEHCTVYVIERRGRGQSGDGVEYDLEREAEDVVAVVEAIDGPVTLLGHSGGALYSLEAATRTDNLRALILYEPPIQVDDTELDIVDEITEMRRLVAGGEDEQALVLFQSDIAGIPPEEIDAFRSTPIWEDMVDAAYTLPRELRAISEYEFEADRFAKLTTPTLLLSGSESPPLYKAATEAVDKAFPNSQSATFEKEQHMAMHTVPDLFADTVLTFIRDLD